MWPTLDQWRHTVPGLVDRYATQWGLTLGGGYSGGSASHVVRARTEDGVAAVLKLSLPHREARDEAAARDPRILPSPHDRRVMLRDE